MNSRQKSNVPAVLNFTPFGVQFVAQAPLKQFGTRIYDEAGRRVTFANASRLAQGKSKEAEMAFRLAVHMREKQVVYRTMGSPSILWGIIPKYDPFAGSYYDLENAANVGAGAFIWYYSGRRRNLEEVLTVGVAAYNKSLQEEAKAP